uniref:Uncharacterized protein n=1 Tax=Glossina brevipalpis TaxID=37001 RepID=A0A1A9WBW5_9MUSC
MGNERKEKKLKRTKNPTGADDLFKYYKNLIKKLQMDLHRSICQQTQFKTMYMEDENIKADLQDKLRERDEKIKKLDADINILKQTNDKATEDLRMYREEFYKLEITYDENNKLFQRENEILSQQMSKTNNEKNQQIDELTKRCNELYHQYAEKAKACEEINSQYEDATININKLQQQLAEKEENLEEFAKVAKLQMETSNKKFEDDLNELKKELENKELDLRRIIKDKEEMEKEKDRIIGVQRYKMREVERVFGQPTSMIKPSNAMSNASKQNNNDENSSQIVSENIAVAQPMMDHSSSSDEEITNREVSVQNLNKSMQHISYNSKEIFDDQSKPKTARKRAFGCKREFCIPSSSLLRSNSTDEDSDYTIDAWRPSIKNPKKVSYSQ